MNCPARRAPPQSTGARRVVREPAGARDAVGEETTPSTTSTAARRDRRARLPTSPLQPGSVETCRGGFGSASPACGASRTAAIATADDPRRASSFTPPHTRPIAAGRRRRRRSARRKRSSPHCRCRARAARLLPPAAQRAARSWRRHRRRSRSARRRSARRPRACARRAPDDRALVRGGEVGAPLSSRRAIAHGVQKRGLHAGEREVEAGDPRDREVGTPPVALARRAGRSPRRRGSRGRGAERPCRTPRRLRRRGRPSTRKPACP